VDIDAPSLRGLIRKEEELLAISKSIAGVHRPRWCARFIYGPRRAWFFLSAFAPSTPRDQDRLATLMALHGLRTTVVADLPNDFPIERRRKVAS
jgi:hypothetical protein